MTRFTSRSLDYSATTPAAAEPEKSGTQQEEGGGFRNGCVVLDSTHAKVAVGCQYGERPKSLSGGGRSEGSRPEVQYRGRPDWDAEQRYNGGVGGIRAKINGRKLKVQVNQVGCAAAVDSKQ